MSEPDLPLPFVSVLMPVRNEAAFIARSLGAMLAQDYPHDRYEILVLDGMSDDATRARVEQMARTTNLPVRLLDNPARTVPPALNLGIREARGDIILRMDGHTEAAPDYVHRCVSALLNTGADNVGGAVDYVGEDPFSCAAGMVSQSKFGCGGAPARSSREGSVDTVSFGCWRREAFSRFGLFDEYFVRTQDSEFNYRTRLLGGRVWMNPCIRTRYFNRSSPRRLARQYFQYGFWKTRLMYKLGGHLQWRHLVPPAFVAGCGLSVVALIWQLLAGPFRLGWAVVFATPVAYALASLFASLCLAARNRAWSMLPLFMLILAILHTAWGTGFIVGLLRRPPRTCYAPLPPATPPATQPDSAESATRAKDVSDI